MFLVAITNTTNIILIFCEWEEKSDRRRVITRKFSPRYQLYTVKQKDKDLV